MHAAGITNLGSGEMESMVGPSSIGSPRCGPRRADLRGNRTVPRQSSRRRAHGSHDDTTITVARVIDPANGDSPRIPCASRAISSSTAGSAWSLGEDPATSRTRHVDRAQTNEASFGSRPSWPASTLARARRARLVAASNVVVELLRTHLHRLRAASVMVTTNLPFEWTEVLGQNG